MCGICGIARRGQLREGDAASVQAMMNAMIHRGPDGEGRYQNGSVSLGMRRLSIIDVEGSDQPLYNEDGSLVLIANAEIYNYVELRSELQAQGHVFSSNGDCETILHLYERDGDRCVESLEGMFAFALWDVCRRRLLLARDRMGEKPLYIYEKDRGIVFASEMKALLRSGYVPFEIEPNCVNLYFHYQYVPEPLTLLKSVRKLAAAHVMSVDVDSWSVDVKCYWNMEDAPPLRGNPAALIREELERVSELILRSDVPVGVALSGGIDSGGVASLAVKHCPGVLHAFTVGYPGCPDSDERAAAKALAHDLNMPFHEVEVSLEEMARSFENLIYLRDDPVSDIAGYGYYAVMKKARECSVPVVIQGQGGDELFWGYDHVRRAAIESLMKKRLSRWRYLALPEYLYYALTTRKMGNASRCGSLFAKGRDGWWLFSAHKRSPANRLRFIEKSPNYRIAEERVYGCYTPEFVDRLDRSRPNSLFTMSQPWRHPDISITRLICQTYLMGNGIVQGDRLAMAASVEMRLPFLNHRLVETVVGLRKLCRDCKYEPKAWLKEALKGVLPDETMARRKRGFTPPVREWHEELFKRYGDQLRNGFLVNSGILTRDSADELAAIRPDPYMGDSVSFKALVLELWCGRFSNLAATNADT